VRVDGRGACTEGERPARAGRRLPFGILGDAEPRETPNKPDRTWTLGVGTIDANSEGERAVGVPHQPSDTLPIYIEQLKLQWHLAERVGRAR
jgi:hypothetical protein